MGSPPQEGLGTGGTVTVPAVVGTDYLIAVFSAGGTGTMFSPHGYTAAGAFTLRWEGANSAPDAVDDIVGTGVGQRVTIDVLGNDADADTDPLTVVSTDGTSEGGVVDRDATNGNVLVYSPPPGFVGVDSFRYDIADGRGGTDAATVTVYVGIPIPGPSPIEITPSPIDFGTVPLGKTADVEVTITNTSAESVGPFMFVVDQDAPLPFDGSATSGCTFLTLEPGDSCLHRVRFWSITDADAASPAQLRVFSSSTFAEIASVSLIGATGPAVPPTPNSDPIATDDLTLAASGFTHFLAPLLNDYDPDSDALTVATTGDPVHGSISGIVRCADHVGGSLVSPQGTCVRYIPEPGFVGVDQFTYTISDGRGGSASATYYIAMDNPDLALSSVEPEHGQPEGGSSVVIRGSNFVPGVLAGFVCDGSYVGAPITGFQTTQLTVTQPPLPPGVCDVQVSYGPLGTATLSAAYTVAGGGNRPPNAVDDSATVRQTNTVAIPVLANDSDPDPGDSVQIVGDTQPAHGRLDVTVADVYEYTPDSGYLGPDSFTYTIADESGQTATATVQIDVTQGLASVRANATFADSGLALGERACFELVGEQGRVGAEQCLDAGEQTAVFDAVPLGSYSVAVSTLPALPPGSPMPRLPGRYVVPAPVPVNVTRDGLTEIVTVDIALGPQPTLVRLHGVDGELLPGACMGVFTDTQIPSFVAVTCDAADGANDGVSTFTDWHRARTSPSRSRSRPDHTDGPPAAPASSSAPARPCRRSSPTRCNQHVPPRSRWSTTPVSSSARAVSRCSRATTASVKPSSATPPTAPSTVSCTSRTCRHRSSSTPSATPPLASTHPATSPDHPSNSPTTSPATPPPPTPGDTPTGPPPSGWRVSTSSCCRVPVWECSRTRRSLRSWRSRVTPRTAPTTECRRSPALAPGSYFAKPFPFPSGPYGWTARGASFVIRAGTTLPTIVTYALQPARTAEITMVNDTGVVVREGCLEVFEGDDRVGEAQQCDASDGTHRRCRALRAPADTDLRAHRPQRRRSPRPTRPRPRTTRPTHLRPVRPRHRHLHLATPRRDHRRPVGGSQLRVVAGCLYGSVHGHADPFVRGGHV